MESKKTLNESNWSFDHDDVASYLDKSIDHDDVESYLDNTTDHDDVMGRGNAQICLIVKLFLLDLVPFLFCIFGALKIYFFVELESYYLKPCI